jgi:hypothetical protein
MKASPIQTSFNAGELTPLLQGRPDLGKYKNGCKTMLNFIPQIHGPAQKRTGTKFVNEVKDSTKKTRLIPFEFNTEQAYVLEFGNLYIRFYMNGGQILSGGSAYEVATPYLDTELDGVRYAQSADVMYITHPNHPPYKLSRTAHDNWTMAIVDFDWPPFNSENTSVLTITASAITGAGITLTASAALFSATQVGAYFKFSEVLNSKYNLWEPAKAITSGDRRVYDGALYKATSSATTGTRPPIHIKGTESDGAVNWEYQHDGSGYVVIKAYTSTTVVTADVVKLLPSSSLSASDRWAEGAWSDYLGWPKTIVFYEDRLWLGGSANKPQTLWASASSDYENHKYGTRDDDALNYTINSQEVNVIQWLSPGKALIVGTSGSEFVVKASSIDEPITPTNVSITPQTSYGSASFEPTKVGGAVLFVQRSSKKIREFIYRFDNDAYVAPNLSLLSEHITQQGIIAVAYQQEPDQILWAPCADGELVGMTYERSEDVVGWHRHNISGIIESIVSIPHWDNDQDSTWVVVKRTIDGSDVRYIEYFEKYKVDEYAHFVDSGLMYEGVAATVISGLDHLEGEEVAVLTNGAVHPNRTVTGGEITLQYESTIVTVGLPFTSVLETMPLEAGAADGTSQGKNMRITNLTIRVDKTGAGLWFGSAESMLDEIHFRSSNTLMDNPVPLLTGDTELLPFPAGYEVGTSMVLHHVLPLPCTILALMPQVVTNDR